MKKFLLIFFLSLILLITALSLYLSIKLEDIILYSLTKYTGISVTCRDFQVGIFRGFTIRDAHFTLPQDSLIQSVEAIDLTYSFRELLKRKVKITGVRIISPKIRLIQFPDGEWNFSRLFKTTAADTAPIELPVVFEVDKIEVADLFVQAKSNFGNIELSDEIIRFDNSHYNSMDNFAFSARLDNLVLNFNSIDPLLDVHCRAGLTAEITQDSMSVNLNSTIDANILSNALSDYRLNLRASGSRNGWKLNIPGLQFSSANGSDLSIIADLQAESVLTSPQFSGRIELKSLNLKHYLKILNLDFIDVGKSNLGDSGYLSFSGSYDMTNQDYQLSLEIDQALRLAQITSLNPPVEIAESKSHLNLLASLDKNSLNLQNFSFDIDNRHITSPLFEQFKVTLENNNFNLSMKDGQIHCFANGSLSDSTSFTFKAEAHLPSNLLNIQPSLDYLDSLAVKIEQLPLINLTDSSLAGHLSTAASIVYHGSNTFGLKSKVTFPDTVIILKTYPEQILPLDTVCAAGLLTIANDFKSAQLNSFELSISDYMTLKLHTKIDQHSARVFLDSSAIDLAELYSRLPEFQALYPVDFDAAVNVDGAANLDFDNYLNSELELHGELPAFDLKYSNYSVKNLSSAFGFDFRQDTLKLNMDILLDSLYLPVLRTKPVTGIQFDLDSRFSLDSLSFISSFNSLISSEKTVFAGSAAGNLQQTNPQVSGEMKISFDSTDSLEIIDRHFLQGICELIFQYRIADTAVFNGYVDLQNLNFLTPAFSFSRAGGKVKFEQELSLSPFDVAMSHSSLDPFYLQNLPYSRQISKDSSVVSVDRLQAGEWELSGLKADAFWKNGVFQIDNFEVGFFDGNMSGSGWMKIDTLQTGKLSYHLSARAAEINSAFLSKTIEQGGQASKVSFNMNLSGRQLSPLDEAFDIEGSLHLTKISPKVAENLLIFLDPRQEDKGIQSMLYFLRKGWGIKSFSFEIAHGFVYSTILTQKPTLSHPFPFLVSSVVPIEKEIKLSRLPVKFFLKK